MEDMKKVKIGNKEYVKVHERIKYFRESEKFKGCTFTSKFKKFNNDFCVIEVTVFDPEGNIIANGFAMEARDSSLVNKFNYVENCETSACGRALGNLGIGIDTSVASFEEVENAIFNNNSKELKDVLQVFTDFNFDYKFFLKSQAFNLLIFETETNIGDLLRHDKIDNLENLIKNKEKSNSAFIKLKLKLKLKLEKEKLEKLEKVEKVEK